jgi:hypothetical protein
MQVLLMFRLGDMGWLVLCLHLLFMMLEWLALVVPIQVVLLVVEMLLLLLVVVTVMLVLHTMLLILLTVLLLYVDTAVVVMLLARNVFGLMVLLLLLLLTIIPIMQCVAIKGLDMVILVVVEVFCHVSVITLLVSSTTILMTSFHIRTLLLWPS